MFTLKSGCRDASVTESPLGTSKQIGPVFLISITLLIGMPSLLTSSAHAHPLSVAQEANADDDRIFESGEIRKLGLGEAIRLALEHNLGLQVQRVFPGQGISRSHHRRGRL